MVSIRKYLDMPPLRRAEPEDDDVGELPDRALLRELADRLLAHVAGYVLADGGGETRLAELERARACLRGMQFNKEEVAGIENAVHGALADKASHDKALAERIARETHQVIGVLNDALKALAGGSQRASARFGRIQESLQRTSRMRDIAGLRSSLAQVIELIREESEREREQAARDLAAFESRVVVAQRGLRSVGSPALGDRAGAICRIAQELRNLEPGVFLYAAAIRISKFEAIAQRYGVESVDEIFAQFTRELIQPLAAATTSFRWSPRSLIGLFQSSDDLQIMQSRLAEMTRTPRVHQMALGSRTASLRIGLSHLIVLLLPETLDSLVAEIDRFSGTEASDGG